MKGRIVRAWLENDRVYQTIMNGALVIGFLAALSTEKWPQYTWLSEVIIISVTAAAMSIYFIVRHNEENLSKRSELNSIKKDVSALMATIGNEKPRSDEPATVLGLGFNTEPENYRQLWPDWLFSIKSPKQHPRSNLTPVYYVYAWRQLEAARAAQELAAVKAHNITAHKRLSIDDEVLRYFLSRGNEDSVDTPSQKNLTVKIGPVTIEIKDDETRVHVSSTKPVITNVTGPSDTASINERPGRTPASSRSIH